MLRHSEPKNSNRHCENTCCDVFGIHYLRDYQEALGALADLILRADRQARAISIDQLVLTRIEIEVQLRRVHQWARGASKLHAPTCWWLDELTSIKRRLIERAIWHTNVLSLLREEACA